MIDLTGLGTSLVGLAACITAIAQLRQTRTIRAVHDEVRTANGIPTGELLERAEGRRIEQMPAPFRTASEQGYVDRLNEGGRNRGHEGEQ